MFGFLGLRDFFGGYGICLDCEEHGEEVSGTHLIYVWVGYVWEVWGAGKE